MKVIRVYIPGYVVLVLFVPVLFYCSLCRSSDVGWQMSVVSDNYHLFDDIEDENVSLIPC